MTKKEHLSTIVTHAGVAKDTAYGAVMPPLYATTNYTFESLEKPRRYDYVRSGNPTNTLLSQTLAKLEEGAGGVVTGTGMSALNLLFSYFKQGSCILAPKDCYGGTHRLLSLYQKNNLFDIHFIDYKNQEELKRLAPKADLFFVETPTNPLFKVLDIQEIVKLAQETGAKVAVDNTVLSPVCQKPLTLGVDFVVHSTSKYINGHSDAIGGALVSKTPEDAQYMSWLVNALGLSANPSESHTIQRGLRTLDVRIKGHQEGALTVANFLKTHTSVTNISYTGLDCHPDKAIIEKQHLASSGMLSVFFDTSKIDLKNFIEALNYFALAESLGGVESLICHPWSMTHAAVSEAEKIEAGILHNVIRFSIGLENPQDLIEDLEQALNKSQLK